MFNKAPTSKRCAVSQSVIILYSEDPSGDHFLFFSSCTFHPTVSSGVPFRPRVVGYRPEVLRRLEMLSVREESAIKTRQGSGTSCNIPILCLFRSAWEV